MDFQTLFREKIPHSKVGVPSRFPPPGSRQLGQMDKAQDELTRAYMGAGRDIFANEDPKYLAYLETILQPMPGHEKL